MSVQFYAEVCHACGTHFSIPPTGDPMDPTSYPPCPACGESPLSDNIEPALVDADQVLRFADLPTTHPSLVERARAELANARR